MTEVAIALVGESFMYSEKITGMVLRPDGRNQGRYRIEVWMNTTNLDVREATEKQLNDALSAVSSYIIDLAFVKHDPQKIDDAGIGQACPAHVTYNPTYLRGLKQSREFSQMSPNLLQFNWDTLHGEPSVPPGLSSKDSTKVQSGANSISESVSGGNSWSAVARNDSPSLFQNGGEYSNGEHESRGDKNNWFPQKDASVQNGQNGQNGSHVNTSSHGVPLENSLEQPQNQLLSYRKQSFNGSNYSNSSNGNEQFRHYRAFSDPQYPSFNDNTPANQSTAMQPQQVPQNALHPRYRANTMHSGHSQNYSSVNGNNMSNDNSSLLVNQSNSRSNSRNSVNHQNSGVNQNSVSNNVAANRPNSTSPSGTNPSSWTHSLLFNTTHKSSKIDNSTAASKALFEGNNDHTGGLSSSVASNVNNSSSSVSTRTSFSGAIGPLSSTMNGGNTGSICRPQRSKFVFPSLSKKDIPSLATLNQMLGPYLEHYHIELVDPTELNSKQVAVLRQEGCAKCLQCDIHASSPPNNDSDIKISQDGRSGIAASSKEHSRQHYLFFYSRLLRSVHVAHLACVVDAIGAPTVYTPALQSNHSTNFFHVVPMDIPELMTAPALHITNSGRSGAYNNRSYSVDIIVSHILSDGHLLRLTWPRPHTSHIPDKSNGNGGSKEYLFIDVSNPPQSSKRMSPSPIGSDRNSPYPNSSEGYGRQGYGRHNWSRISNSDQPLTSMNSAPVSPTDSPVQTKRHIVKNNDGPSAKGVGNAIRDHSDFVARRLGALSSLSLDAGDQRNSSRLSFLEDDEINSGQLSSASTGMVDPSHVEFNQSRGLFTFKCVNKADGLSWHHSCNFDLSAVPDIKSAVKLVLVDERTRNIVSVGLYRSPIDELNTNTTGVNRGWCISFVKCEFSGTSFLSSSLSPPNKNFRHPQTSPQQADVSPAFHPQSSSRSSTPSSSISSRYGGQGDSFSHPQSRQSNYLSSSRQSTNRAMTRDQPRGSSWTLSPSPSPSPSPDSSSVHYAQRSTHGNHMHGGHNLPPSAMSSHSQGSHHHGYGMQHQAHSSLKPSSTPPPPPVTMSPSRKHQHSSSSSMHRPRLPSSSNSQLGGPGGPQIGITSHPNGVSNIVFQSSGRENYTSIGSDHGRGDAGMGSGMMSNNSPPLPMLSKKDVVGNVVMLAKSHNGSRFVQQKLDARDPEYFDIFFNEMKEAVPDLMVDNFGHFAIEKLIAICTDQQNLILLEKLAPALIGVSCQKHGSFSVQALIDSLHTRAQIQVLTEALRKDILRVITHSSGHFVVLRMLQRFSCAATSFIDKAIIQHCLHIGTDHHGLRVVKAVINSREPMDLEGLHACITHLAMDLVENQYGNYVIQCVLDSAPPNVRSDIQRKMRGRYMRLSKQKFSSNVVEKCLKQGSNHWQNVIINELTSQPEVSDLLRDRYGNYVLQTALSIASGAQVAQIMTSIAQHLPTLRENVRIKWRKMLKKAVNRLPHNSIMSYPGMSAALIQSL